MPTAFRSALDALAQLSVTGITTHYPLMDLPLRIPQANLPALLMLPLETQEQGLFANTTNALEWVTFSGGANRYHVGVTHLMLIAPTRPNNALLRHHVSTLVDATDAYLNAIGANPTLNDTLAKPTNVRVDVGIQSYGGDTFYGARFKHDWVLAL